MTLHLAITLICSGAYVLFATQLPGQDQPDLAPRNLVDSNQAEEPPFPTIPDPQGHAYFPKRPVHDYATPLQWYTQKLSALKEPSLLPSANKPQASILRFTWMRSFHGPIAVRIWEEGGERYMRAVRVAQDRQYKLGPINHDQTRKLTKEEWAEVESLFRDPGFWAPLSFAETELSGLDGSTWLFERLENAQFHAIEVWSPNYLSESVPKLPESERKGLRSFVPYARAGMHLLQLAKVLPEEKLEIY